MKTVPQRRERARWAYNGAAVVSKRRFRLAIVKLKTGIAEMTMENESGKLRSSLNLAARFRGECIAMRQKECGQSRRPDGETLGRLVLAALVVLITAFLLFPAAQAKEGKSRVVTQVCQRSYDEVFQASQEAVGRLGYSVTDKDKDKGTISGGGTNPMIVGAEITFDIRIEALNSKPETRVTMSSRLKKHGLTGGGPGEFPERFLSELQKVLATYR